MKPQTLFSIKLYSKIIGIALLSAAITILSIHHLWLFGALGLIPLVLLAISLSHNISKSANACEMLINAIEDNDETFLPARHPLHPAIAENLLRIRNILSEKQSIILGQEMFFKEIIEFLHTGIFCMLPDENKNT